MQLLLAAILAYVSSPAGGMYMPTKSQYFIAVKLVAELRTLRYTVLLLQYHQLAHFITAPIINGEMHKITV